MSDSMKTRSEKIAYSEQLFHEGKIAEAEELLMFIIIISNYKNLIDLDEVLNNLGVINYHNKNLEKALFYINNAIKINPFNKKAIHNFFAISQVVLPYHQLLPIIKNFLQRYPNDKEILNILKKIPDELKQETYYEREIHAKDCSEAEQSYISKVTSQLLKNKLFFTDKINKLRLNKPHRNLVLMSLFPIKKWKYIFNQLQNFTYVEKEVEEVNQLFDLFIDNREQILKDNVTNLQFDENIVVSLNISFFHLVPDGINEINDNLGYPFIALICDPVKTISFWNRKNEICDPLNLVEKNSQYWQQKLLKTEDRVEKLAIKWENYAKCLWQLKSIIKIYSYELICHKMYKVLIDICDYLAIPYCESINSKSIEKDEFDKIDLNNEKIIKAVQKMCPTRKKFGYDKCNLIPGGWDIEPTIFSRSVPTVVLK